MRISQRVTELWSVQECLEKSKGHNSKTKEEGAIILVRDTSSIVNTYFYKIA